MKRSVGIMVLTVIVAIVLSACSQAPARQAAAPQSTGPQTIRFSEVIHSVFYAPQYVAMSQKFFEEEGLILDTSTSQGSDKGVAALLAGTADIALVGPEAAVFIQNQETPNKVKIFSQLTAKDGSFLMSRQPMDKFSWDNLKGKTVVGWRPGSMPQMVMDYTLRQNGMKPGEDVEVITNLAAPAMAGAFQSGKGDFIQLFEPVVSTLEREKAGYTVISMGEAAGNFPYTVYMATEKFIEEQPDLVARYTRAIYKGMLWVEGHSAADVARAVQPYFEETPLELLEAAIDRYKKQGTWSPIPVPDAAQMERLQDIMVSGGVLTADGRVAYEQIVVPEFARQAMEQVKR